MRMTRAEILAVYAAGPEAVVSLVEVLLTRIEQQERQITQLTARVAELSARVEELERRRAQTSRTSHQPPSSDGLRRAPKPRSLRAESTRRSGGQPGHAGQTLRPVEEPEARQRHAPACCTGCGCAREAVAAERCERRQVFDLPELRLHVTEHEVQTKRCPGCGALNRGYFPLGVEEPVQYGPRLLALAAYLQSYQLLPFARTQQLLEDLFGHAPSQGTLAHHLERAAERLGPLEAGVRAALIESAAAVHCDETGVRIEGRLAWLHVASTRHLTLYAAHARRGREALEALGVLGARQGVCVHDAYPAYLRYALPHALCNAHLLRELFALEEETHALWPTALVRLLLEMQQAVESARAAGARALPPGQLQELEARWERILALGEATHPPPLPTGRAGRQKRSRGRNLLDRLQRHRAAVLAFLYDFAVPFDNNQAERDLRMAKLHQKISGSFRSWDGARTFCRLRSYLSTLRKQGLHVLSALEQLFQGNLLWPQLVG